MFYVPLFFSFSSSFFFRLHPQNNMILMVRPMPIIPSMTDVKCIKLKTKMKDKQAFHSSRRRCEYFRLNYLGQTKYAHVLLKSTEFLSIDLFLFIYFCFFFLFAKHAHYACYYLDCSCYASDICFIVFSLKRTGKSEREKKNQQRQQRADAIVGTKSTFQN